jgi:hypothetical protein
MLGVTIVLKASDSATLRLASTDDAVTEPDAEVLSNMLIIRVPIAMLASRCAADKVEAGAGAASA